MALFSPKREDGRAEWRVVFDLVEDMQPGDVIPYRKLLEALETTDKAHLYRVVGRCNEELWRTRSRSLDSVRGQGYRMLAPTEHEALAYHHKKKARRQMGKSVAIIRATDVSEMTPNQRQWVDQVTSGLVLLANALDVTNSRLAKHQDLIDHLTKRVDRLEEDNR